MARMRECPSCGLTFEDEGQDACPYCGYEFPQQRSSLKWAAILMALLLAWPVLRLVLALFD